MSKNSKNSNNVTNVTNVTKTETKKANLTPISYTESQYKEYKVRVLENSEIRAINEIETLLNILRNWKNNASHSFNKIDVLQRGFELFGCSYLEKGKITNVKDATEKQKREAFNDTFKELYATNGQLGRDMYNFLNPTDVKTKKGTYLVSALPQIELIPLSGVAAADIIISKENEAIKLKHSEANKVQIIDTIDNVLNLLGFSNFEQLAKFYKANKQTEKAL